MKQITFALGAIAVSSFVIAQDGNSFGYHWAIPETPLEIMAAGTSLMASTDGGTTIAMTPFGGTVTIAPSSVDYRLSQIDAPRLPPPGPSDGKIVSGDCIAPSWPGWV